jgi:hypothetical protein
LGTTEGILDTKIKSVSSKNVNKFSDVLWQEMHKLHFSPNKIFIYDEIDATVVRSKATNILALKAKRQIGGLTSAYRRGLAIFVSCMNPART